MFGALPCAVGLESAADHTQLSGTRTASRSGSRPRHSFTLRVRVSRRALFCDEGVGRACLPGTRRSRRAVARTVKHARAECNQVVRAVALVDLCPPCRRRCLLHGGSGVRVRVRTCVVHDALLQRLLTAGQHPRPLRTLDSGSSKQQRGSADPCRREWAQPCAGARHAIDASYQ